MAPVAPPAIISYQGFLQDDVGDPVTDNLDMTFRFFTLETGGDEVLVDAHLVAGTGSVAVDQGVFNVSLGGGALQDGSGAGTYTTLHEVFRDFSEVWLQLDIDDGGGSETLDPRTRIHSVAYAINARYLDGADLRCPAGMTRFWTKCISAVQTPVNMYSAIDNCGVSFGGYVCTYMDYMQACYSGAITSTVNSLPGWLGDHVTIQNFGNGDDEYLTINNTNCNANIDGPPVLAPTASYSYRCCR